MKRQELIARHQQQRAETNKNMLAREQREMVERAARLPKGMAGLWSKLTGRFSDLKRENEFQALKA
jgi:hypothetical protein